jgi:hypothetical protein
MGGMEMSFLETHHLDGGSTNRGTAILAMNCISLAAIDYEYIQTSIISSNTVTPILQQL